MDLEEIALQTANWIYLAEDLSQWVVRVNTARTFMLHKRGEIFCLVLVVC